MTNLILAATAAALVASFRSFPMAFAAGSRSASRRPSSTATSSSRASASRVPFIVIVLVLVLRGQALPLRDYFLQRLPVRRQRAHQLAVDGRSRVGAGGAAAGHARAGVDRRDHHHAVASRSSCCRSSCSPATPGSSRSRSSRSRASARTSPGRLVASAGHAVLARAAARRARRRSRSACSSRCRRCARAASTSRSSRSASGPRSSSCCSATRSYTGGIEGTQIGDAHLFGIDINAITHPTRYGLFALACFVLAALVVANVRRGRTGRRLIAVRTNERAAAALGISVAGAKLYAFAAVGGRSPALGGILLAFRDPARSTTRRSTTSRRSSTVGLALIGGLGYLVRAGASARRSSTGGVQRPAARRDLRRRRQVHRADRRRLASSSSCSRTRTASSSETIGQIALGQGASWAGGYRGSAAGAAAAARAARSRARSACPRTRWRCATSPSSYGGRDGRRRRVADGAARAHHRADRAQRRRQDDVHRRRHRLHRAEPAARCCSTARTSRAGPWPRAPAPASAARSSRSSSSRTSSVLDNLRVASDPRDRASYLRDLVYPVTPPLPGEVVSAIHEFTLEEDLDRAVRGPALRQAPAAGDRARRRDAPERAAARRARRRPRRRRDGGARATSSGASRTSGAWPSCSSSTT